MVLINVSIQIFIEHLLGTKHCFSHLVLEIGEEGLL